jgi:acyl-homoserine lactone acylase PvdQ
MPLNAVPPRALPIIGALVAALALGVTSATGVSPPDRALIALDILPPGQGANVPELTSQIALYDGLTPLGGKVSAADLPRFYKPETLGLGGAKATRVERPRAGVTIDRDSFDVPHIYGTNRANTEYGAGWVTAEDRGLDLQLLRGPARIAALDVPGYDAFSVALSARTFVPSAATESFLATQATLAEKTPAGRQLLKDVDAYVLGINAYFKAQGGFVTPFDRNDITAIGTLIGAVFGAGGGSEGRSAQLLSALQQRLGDAKGLEVWNSLRESENAETPVSIAKRFPYEDGPTDIGAGNVRIDAGSYRPIVAGGGTPETMSALAATSTHRLMSNALLIGAKRSAGGHPIFVAGPQVGYFSPEILMEEDLHGGGLDARGVSFPGLGFYLQIGRGPDYAWSATSASSDVTDQFAETLCGGDSVHYLYKGVCTPMGTFDAGTLKGQNGGPDTELTYRTTIHGPVVAYATSDGVKVALSLARSTRGRELLGALAFQKLSTGAVQTPQQFFDTMAGFELTFNWFYADSKHIAMYSSGRLPLRAADVDPGLPTNGDGSHEWTGWLSAAAHPHVLDPASGEIVNWNNKPAAGFGAADDNFAYGSLHRVEMLLAPIGAIKLHTPASVVSSMNVAATEDLRDALVGLLAQAMPGGGAPSARDAQLLSMLRAWSGSRIDADLDGKIDSSAAAIMDAWWPRLAVAVLQNQLGSLTSDLQALAPISNDANSGGSSYGSGWYSYVEEAVRAAIGPASPTLHTALTCGDGTAASCSAALWQSLDAAGNALAAAQGPDPFGWHSDATAERIHFTGFLSDTMRWANRPTFQQVISFRSHR